jgi:hypothetical protein
VNPIGLDELHAVVYAWARRRDSVLWWRRLRIAVVAHRTIVHLRASLQVSRHTSAVVYRAEAPFLLPVGPRLGLKREGTFRMWLEQFGYQDLAIGDPPFDDAFTLKSDRPDVARRCLRPIAARVLALKESARFGSTRDAAEVSGRSLVKGEPALMPDHTPDRAVAKIVGAVDVVAALASTDLYQLDALLVLPGAEVRWPDLQDALPGPPVVVLGDRGVELTVVVERGRPCTVARVADQSGRGRREEAGPQDGTRLAGDGRVLHLRWPTTCGDPAALLAGVRALERLAAPPHGGPYR